MKNKKWLTATNIIILICVFVYILDRFVFVGDMSEMENFSLNFNGQDMGQNPIFLKFIGVIFGKLYYFMAIPPASQTTYFWQPFTYIFMHQFILHIIVNMIALYIVGNKVEKEKGPLFTIFSFSIIGIIGVLITNAILPGEAYTAGSSIAVFGLIGCALGIWITNKEFIKNFKIRSIVYVALYGLIFTYISGDWTMAAHNIGLVLGIIIYFLYHFLFEKTKS